MPTTTKRLTTHPHRTARRKAADYRAAHDQVPHSLVKTEDGSYIYLSSYTDALRHAITYRPACADAPKHKPVGQVLKTVSHTLVR